MLYTNELTHLSKEDRRTVELAQERDPKLREDVFPVLEALSEELAAAKDAAEKHDDEVKRLEYELAQEAKDATTYAEERDAAERRVAKLTGHLDDLKAAVRALRDLAGTEEHIQEIERLLLVDHHKL